MRAITIDAYKTQPHLQELPRPQPGEGEILIRLHAAGVNPMDWKARDGTYQQWWPAEFPVVLGFDGAGVVEQAGAGVSAFRPGDAVFGQFMPQRVHHWGTYADYVWAPPPPGRWPPNPSRSMTCRLPLYPCRRRPRSPAWTRSRSVPARRS